MELSYFPGCSLTSTGRAYDESTRAICHRLGVDLRELQGWNCCGATSYMSVRELVSFAISARNLSIAQQTGRRDLVAPCSACYTILRKTDHYLQEMPELRAKVGQALDAAGLSYEPGSVHVRHLLEVLSTPEFLARIRDEKKVPLQGLKVAPYYGCQTTRPAVDWDHAEYPTRLDELLRALGAEVVPFSTKARCCGASLMASNPSAAMRLCKNLLLCAQQGGAQVIATVCPLCQMNLDAFQDKVNGIYGTQFQIPVLYFTQLMSVAFGLQGDAFGLGREIVPAAGVMHSYLSAGTGLAVREA